METIITYFYQKAKVNCDGNCQKAWGINNRPENKKDCELGIAPIDPGTYEDGYGKPPNNEYFPNKWCVRECERCNMSKPGEFNTPLPIITF